MNSFNDNINEDIIQKCAQTLAENSVPILAEAIENAERNHLLQDNVFSEDWGYMYAVLEYIARSGFDVSNWKLGEIPHPNIYCFHHVDIENNNQQFDICVDPLQKDKIQITPAYTKDGYNIVDAESIDTAIEGYVRFNEYNGDVNLER